MSHQVTRIDNCRKVRSTTHQFSDGFLGAAILARCEQDPFQGVPVKARVHCCEHVSLLPEVKV